MIKRRSLIVICYAFMALIIIVLIFAFAYPFYKWSTMNPVPMNIWIVDKTVPNTDYREHKGLMWVLNNDKIVNPKTGEAYRYDSDYYGFFPIDKDHYDIKELVAQDQQPDLIYLADTYGVYKDDYLSVNKEGSRSELLYGGLNDKELALIKKNLSGGNTIIGEFNTASAPTNIANREQLSEIFRLNWLGWSGRYFKDLTKGVEIPSWTVSDYEAQSGEKWNFEGEGFVLVSDNDKVVVLRKGIEIGSKDLTFSFEKSYFDEFGIDKTVPYDYWFEFTQTNPSADILANYQIDLTEKGQAVFDNLGLPKTFPATIRSKNTQYTSYYFAGDFADSTNSGKWSDFYGYSKLKSIFTLGAKGDNSQFYWKCYVPMMTKILKDIAQHKAEPTNQQKPNGLQYNSRVSGTVFQIYQGNQWIDFYSKGVNIGSSTPGKAFTEFSKDENLYLDWFEKLAAMNANTIRVYTLQSPQFYNALTYYNRTHPNALLKLYQEIWPEENPKNSDYLTKTYNEAYQNEIRNVVDAIHGNANIPARSGRAYGIYTSDISAYIAGYLVGRELEPEEVISTNQLNQNLSYSGEYLYCEPAASPTEAWLAMSCDYVLTYEAKEYNWQHPIGIVSWPTLDPTEHDSEWNTSGDKSLEYNDKVSININNISVRDTLKTGFFGAYHIYPNYPDFMNNEECYANYKDEEGIFRYGGYLREFIQTQKKYPALVAEFGLSTGMGNAHTNPDGYNHGGLTEVEQGEGIVRMMKAIQREGYAGGLVFEWADEWAKKTWTTEPFIIPFDRNVLWHNAVDPEQNYGILAMESSDQKSEPYAINGTGTLQEIKLSADETYLSIQVGLNKGIDFSKETLIIGLDTYDRSKGNAKYSNDISYLAPSGLEFEIRIEGLKNAQLLVQPSYDVTKNSYLSVESSLGDFEKMTMLINNERTTKAGKSIGAVYKDLSSLSYGTFENNSYYNWVIEGNQITIRIPWTRINFTDPSTMRVLDDKSKITAPTTDELKTLISDGILASGLLVGKVTNNVTATIGSKEDKPFTWANWNIPTYQERLKDSYSTIQSYFATIK